MVDLSRRPEADRGDSQECPAYEVERALKLLRSLDATAKGAIYSNGVARHRGSQQFPRNRLYCTSPSHNLYYVKCDSLNRSLLACYPAEDQHYGLPPASERHGFAYPDKDDEQ